MAEEESQYAQLSMKFQRDINCISDPDRNVRRRALDKLSRSLKNDTASVSNNVLQNLFTKNLKAPLLNCITSDNVEKCREKSLNILTLFAEKNAIPHSEEALKDLVQMLNARMGKLPYSEPTEEIRFLSLQFLWTYLKHRVDVGAEKKGTLLNVIPDLANVLGKASVDPFPDVKKVTADLTILISKNWPNDMRLQLATIAKPMVTNIGHQHSRVRVCALSALEALIPCGAETLPELMNDILIPALTKVIFDRTPSVRKQFVLLVATWFKEITIIKQFQTTLLPFLLAGMTDESPEVQQITHIKLEELSSKWEQEQADSTEIEPMAIDEDGSTFPGAANVPFKTRTPRGARLLASSIISEVIPALLEKTCDWTVQTREKYTKILSIFLALVENNMNPFLDKIFTALAKTCRDDEDIVIKSVKECMNIVGHYADSQMVLASLLPMVAGRLAGQDTAQHRTNGLTLLGMTVEGMTLKTIEAHLDAITEALCDNGVRESENAELQDQLAGVVSSVLHTSGPLIIQKDLYSFRLFWILNHLLSSSNESSLAYEKALDCVQELAAKSSINVEKLYQKFLGKLLEQMQLPSDPKKTWKKNDPSRVLFDSLCRRAGAACADNVNTIIPVFLLHLDPAQDADVRLAFLALLESMLGTDSIAQSFKPHSTSLLLKGIVPNIVWQGGRVAATIRKVGVACAYTLLRQGLADQACLFESAPQMLPVLKSSMDDSDSKTRQLVCLAMQYLFVALPGCLGPEPVHELYSEILKRLDDSNDLVRKAACQTFITFLRAAPKEHFKGTVIDYTLDCLFVHLDDSDPDIQDSVFDVLKEAIYVDTSLIIKKAKENRGRHQNPRYCDEILKLAQSS